MHIKKSVLLFGLFFFALLVALPILVMEFSNEPHYQPQDNVRLPFMGVKYDPLDGSNYSCNELNADAQALNPLNMIVNGAMPSDEEIIKAIKARQYYARYCQRQSQEDDAWLNAEDNNLLAF